MGYRQIVATNKIIIKKQNYNLFFSPYPQLFVNLGKNITIMKK